MRDSTSNSIPNQSDNEGIQDQPINPDGNPAIIIPPPIVNMPADIVPDTPAN